MTRLMVYAGEIAADAAVTRTGGVPLTPADFRWPTCTTCERPLQFLAQVRLGDLAPAGDGPGDDRVLAIFMCQNDPGGCDEWDPVVGGNQAFLLPSTGLTPAAVPEGGNTLLGEVSAVAYVDSPLADYADAQEAWARQENRSPREVLGQLGGRPDWIQNEEAPSCLGCTYPMEFIVQLEEGRDHRTAANFGGGGGYGFACRSCDRGAFLWQQ